MPKMKDSDPDKWEYREHTRVKHILLEKYLAAWIPILGKANPAIRYVDGFAGRGDYVDGTVGSPVIALKVADKLSKYFEKFICYFIEKDESNFANLEEILAREAPGIQNSERIEVEIKNADFAGFVGELLGTAQTGSTFIPSFFFIDPFGFTGIPFSTVAKILSNPKTEIFFTFMVRDIARFIQLPEQEANFNGLFGTDKWKAILASSDKTEVALIDLYREQLHEVARVRYSWAFRVCASEKLQTLYYLLHATNNHKGHAIMKDIMFNQSANADFAYLGPQDVAAKSQMRLFEVHSIDDLKDYLVKRFVGKAVSYDRIQQEVCVPWQTEPPYVDKQFREALRLLEGEERVQVRRVTSRTSRGLSGADIVTFQPEPGQLTLVPVVAGARPKVHSSLYTSLSGVKEILVSRVNDGSIISRFDKTPLPASANDVVCPHFLELKWAYGCSFDCAWCYLKGTFRFRPEGKKPAFKDFEKIALHTRAFLEEATRPEILDTGEIADSLMGEGLPQPFSKFIIPIFETQSRHKVLFVTKSKNIRHLLETDPHSQVIVSFSLNGVEVANTWEKGAPPVCDRIEAGRKLSQAGFEVRVRIDPIVPIEDWQTQYLALIDQLFANFVPSRITLGSLRGLQSTINQSKDRTWLQYLSETSNWGKKVGFTTRYQIYAMLIRYLKDHHNYTDIALCKETVSMWRALGLDYTRIRCNCVW